MAIPPPRGTDWADDEYAAIRRLEKACHASEAWSLECSHTDADHPRASFTTTIIRPSPLTLRVSTGNTLMPRSRGEKFRERRGSTIRPAGAAQ